jgi:hypothetical protein
MLSVANKPILLSVVKLSVMILKVIILSVVMSSVVAPKKEYETNERTPFTEKSLTL